ncbi:Claspin [Caenorhabditis elegans]|uniref:Claspin n=2 Tax=Caenorhabditis elegans TaxID=6239 RepID=O17838_CAEEL|nr:Claspin [Caenorhabditis elegans]CAB02986.2 Claspin [Caenorhabditis elegans]|eukprot:NP_001251008.1 CLaSPin homolog [Caenorhabditis elegans]
MNSDSCSTKTVSADDTDSPSSLVAEHTMSDSQEQLISSENTEVDKQAEEDRKLRRLNRRKALALERSPLPVPKLGRVLLSANSTIDLTNEDDDPSNKWFKKTFNAEKIPKLAKSPEEAKLFAVPRKISKNAPKSLLTSETLKKKLQASMSAKRRKEQEQRRKMYEEDNEHLKAGSDEEEEEDVVFKKKKGKKPVNEEEYKSEDDEDYEPENSGEEDSDEKNNGRADDEMSVNLLNDSFTYDVFNNVKRSGPGSTVSNFDSRSEADVVEKNGVVQLPTMTEITGGSNDILNLCPGSFGVSQSAGFPDTLQMLIEEDTTERKINLPQNSTSVSSDKPRLEESESEDEDDVGVKRRLPAVKNHRVLDSDEEDDVIEETLPSQDVFGSGTLEDSETIKEICEKSGEFTEKIETVLEEKTELKRVVLSDGEDSDEEAEEAEEEGDDEEEPEEDDIESENDEAETEGVEAPDPNFDDEDDELAILKRLQHQEYKQKIKKRTLFDDEASLSGDDVGSDLEDEEGMENVYEAEEGDADDVPDNDTIRRQNHKLLLKQENDKEQRELAKLQDRLLADGDLGGVETNRQFRFKLREEVQIQMGDDVDGNDGDGEDDEPEEDEQKKKERAEMIKFKYEHAEELMLLDEPKQGDDMFARAGKLFKKTEKTVIEFSEETMFKPRLSKPSLLSKTTLAVTFQEVLNGPGGAAKQMYVQSFEKPTPLSTGHISSPSSRLSTGKRLLKSPESSASAKRVRSSKLSSLE